MWLWALRGPTVGPYSGPILWGPAVGRWPPATAPLWDPIVGPCCGPVGEHLGGPSCGPILWSRTVWRWTLRSARWRPTVGLRSGPCGALLWARCRPPEGGLLWAHAVGPYCGVGPAGALLWGSTVGPRSGPCVALLWAPGGHPGSPTVGQGPSCGALGSIVAPLRACRQAWPASLNPGLRWPAMAGPRQPWPALAAPCQPGQPSPVHASPR